MTLNEALAVFHSGDSKRIKKILVEVEKDDALKAAVSEYYADILKYTGGKNLADIVKIPKSLSSKKTRAKAWTPNANSIEILNHVTVDYLFLWKDDLVPSWVEHTNFRSLGIVEHAEKDLTLPISVAELELRNCGITEVPERLKTMKVKWLSLCENEIETVPNWVFEMVERLDVNDNKIQKIELESSYNLNTLRLSNNHISDLSFLSKFPKLDFLTVEKNPISDFPVLNNSPMRALYLSGCKFTEIPASINVLKKLTSLDFSDNPITKVPNLDLPLLDYFEITHTPIGEQNHVTDTLSRVGLQEFLQRNVKSDNDFIGLCEQLESRDSGKMSEAFDVLRANADELQKAEKRYLKFIQSRLGASAGIFDLKDAMLTESEAEAIGNTLKSNVRMSLSYLNDGESRLLVDFLGSMVARVADLEDLKQQLAACTTEEELVELGKKKLSEIKNAIINMTVEYKNGWFGGLLSRFISSPVLSMEMDHTHFDKANRSSVLEGFFIFLQCFAYEDYSLDVFQSDAPRLGEIFWLLPTIPKITWFDVEPHYPASPLAFKRFASLSENNQGKRIKSELLAEAKV